MVYAQFVLYDIPYVRWTKQLTCNCSRFSLLVCYCVIRFHRNIQLRAWLHCQITTQPCRLFQRRTSYITYCLQQFLTKFLSDRRVELYNIYSIQYHEFNNLYSVCPFVLILHNFLFLLLIGEDNHYCSKLANRININPYNAEIILHKSTWRLNVFFPISNS